MTPKLLHSCKPHPGLDPRPGSFAGLMDLYERNYMMLRRLIPAMPEQGTRWVSGAEGALDLHLAVRERFRFTSELGLTYRFVRDGMVVDEPDVLVRIYHDARLAEVMVAHLRHWPAFGSHELLEASPLRERWHVSRFFYKWLGYCLRQGHGHWRNVTGNP